MSTESGIPDYRSPQGSYSKGHKPTTHQQFLDNVDGEEVRKRYWARAVTAAGRFEQVRPNAGHAALAALERRGLVASVVTQNVDRLHQAAGSSAVLDLHGHVNGVRCRSCLSEFPRSAFHEKVAGINSSWLQRFVGPDAPVDMRADADAHLDVKDFADFCVPGCEECGGLLMPTIVFFGGNVPQAVREESFRCVADADKVLVVGSSLATWSSFRLCKAAAQQGKEIGIVNAGPTRADELCAFKLDQTSSATLLHGLLEALPAAA